MKRRIWSFLLALAMVLQLVPAAATAAALPEGVGRVAGESRYETAIAIAEQLKEVLNTEKFDTIILASSDNFADALAGSYLAARKQAPILIGKLKYAKIVRDYVNRNLTEGGTVYVLGGESAVPAAMLEGITITQKIRRLAGADRYGTNLEILREAPIGSSDLLIATGRDFADSLSASATGLPILLVDGKPGRSLSQEQKDFLAGVTGNIYIIGGESAVPASIAEQIEAASGKTAKRIAGGSRYETSIAIARQFLPDADSAVVAYASNFPDGLCGGPLAYALGAPLILTKDGKTEAVNYAAEKGINSGYVLGGESLISDGTAAEIFCHGEQPGETEPEVTEPEVTEPEVTEPEVTEPEVTEPEVTEPEVTEPEVTEPEVTEPEVTEPEVTEPEVTEPEVTEPEVTEPELTEPEVTEPEVTEPEVTEPEVTEPEVTEPEATEPPAVGAMVLSAEKDAQLHADLQNRIDSILNTSTTIVHSDTYIPGQTYTGTAYYVSNDGDDNNDGLSPETAWQTTAKLLQELGQREGHVLQPGDAVFLRRGDTFRLPYWALELYADNITLSAYGEGSKPIITASSENGTGAEKWELVYEDSTGKKIWKFYRDIRDTSMIVMNDGEVITDRVYEYWNGTGYLSCEDVYWGCHDGKGVILFDRLMSLEESLTEDMTIISRPVRGVPDENGCESGPLYLRCDRGNPGSLYASIEFSELEGCALLWIDGCNITLDNISFRCNGNSYLKLSGVENGAPLAHHDYMIQNCEFAYGGASVWDYPSNDGNYFVGAQGDGIYSLIQNTTIRNNYFHDSPATTATYENAEDDPRTAYGYYRVLDNVMVNTLGIRLDCTSESLMHLDSVVIRGNYIWNTGRMDRGKILYAEGSIAMMHSQYGELIIEDNILYGTENGHPMNALMCLYLYDFTSRDRTQPQFRNNVYAQHTGRNFGDFLDEEDKTWGIDDPDLVTKYVEKLHDSTSQFYIIP